MTKRHLRDSIKSFFGSHIDSENDEQLKGAKIGIFYIKIMSIRRLEVVKGILETMKFVVKVSLISFFDLYDLHVFCLCIFKLLVFSL
jgi:hypothetical protein